MLSTNFNSNSDAYGLCYLPSDQETLQIAMTGDC